MDKKIKLLINILLVVFLTFSSNITHALGWGEQTVILQNKSTGEFKKAYKTLYRLDFDSFRDALISYIQDKKLPNSEIFKDWNVLAYKYYERDDCTYSGVFPKTLESRPYDIVSITSSDFTLFEVAEFYYIRSLIPLFKLLLIILGVYIVYHILHRKKLILK